MGRVSAEIDDNTAKGTFVAPAHRTALVTVLSLLASACGAASAVDPAPAFASIQVDEARIEHASLALERAADAEARHARGEEVCAASAHLCETARPLDDRDASERCRRASERCERARQETGAP